MPKPPRLAVRVLLIAAIPLCGSLVPTNRAAAQPPAAAPAGAAADVATESPLLIEPESPEEAFEAATLMVRLARPNLARRYLQQFLDANPDDATLLKLRDKYGPGLFINLDANRELQPLARDLLNRVNAAFRRQANDPARVDRLIDDLTGPADRRLFALTALRNAGPAVVPQMVRRLATPDGTVREAIMAALIRMGSQVVRPLIGALASPDEGVRAAVIVVLGRLGRPEAIPYLTYPAYDPDQPTGVRTAAREAINRIREAEPRATFDPSPYRAVTELKETAARHLSGNYPWPLDEGEQLVTVWRWDDARGTVDPLPMPPEAASLYEATLLARDAARLAPQDDEAEALYLAALLGSAAFRAGLGNPLPTGPGTVFDAALAAGPGVASRALRVALENRNALAAVAALRVLGQIGSRAELEASEGQQSPILDALDFPDRRVQFAAAETILQFDPKRPFPKSHRIVEILARALSDEGVESVVVIDPNVPRANDVAARFREVGFGGGPLVAATGRQGFQIAAARNDVELVAVNANVQQWPLSQTVANLRADSRTAHVPIVIYGPLWAKEGVAYLLERYERVWFVEEPQTTEFLELQLRPFLSQLNGRPLSGEERAEFTAAAAFWLAHLADGQRRRLFDLAPAEPALVQAIEDPATAPNALRALAAIATPAAQVRLQNVAVGSGYAPALREAAALQLAFHIQRFGLLLEPKQILEIKAARDMATEPALATALTSVLGTVKPADGPASRVLIDLPPVLPVAPVAAPTAPAAPMAPAAP